MSLRILVVEDDPGIRGVLERGLRLAGYDATFAPDLSAARRAWDTMRPDLVLLDVMLPDGDGLELLAARRADGDGTPTILLSAREEAELHDRAAAAGVTASVSKPFAYGELLAAIRRALA